MGGDDAMTIHISYIGMSTGATKELVVLGHNVAHCVAGGQCGSAWCLPYPKIDPASVKAGDVVDVTDGGELVTATKGKSP